MGYMVSLLILFTSCAYINGQQFADVQLNVFKVGVLIIWITSLFLNPVRKIKNLWLNIFIAFAFIQTALLPGKPREIALEGLVCLFLAIILYYTVSTYLFDMKPVLRGICWAVGVHGIIVLMQITGIDPVCLNDGGQHNTHLVGLFGRKYLLGSWMAMATPILLFNKRVLFGILAAVLCVCSFSWASIGLMVLTLLTGLFMVNKKIFARALLITIVSMAIIWFCFLSGKQYFESPYYSSPGYYVYNEDGSFATRKELHPTSLRYKIKSRIEIQTKLLPVLFSRPLTGYGLGSFKYIGTRLVNNSNNRYGNLMDAWNDYIEQGVQLGMGFIIIFLCLCRDTIKRFRKSVICPAIIGIFCSLLLFPGGMLFHDVLNHASMNTLSICVFAAFAIRSAGYGDEGGVV